MNAPRPPAGLALALIAFIAVPKAAMAWTNPMDNTVQLHSNLLMGDLRLRAMRRVFQAGRHAHEREAAPSSPPSKDVLSVLHDPSVSRQAREVFIAETARTGGRAEADREDRFFGDIRTTFARVAGPYGLDASNFADVMAAYLIVMWMSANQQTALPQPAQVRAVRRQMYDVFSSAAAVIPDPRRRQLTAEAIMYRTCLAVSIRELAQAKPDILKGLADATDRQMSAQGFSLRDLALTDEGLIER